MTLRKELYNLLKRDAEHAIWSTERAKQDYLKRKAEEDEKKRQELLHGDEDGWNIDWLGAVK
jgi:hypothetical protein